MGCMPSAHNIGVSSVPVMSWQEAIRKGETVVGALARLDSEIAASERDFPQARLAVVSAEIESMQQEIKGFEETAVAAKSDYAKTIHQIFVSLDLYRRPVLASENEDFVANANRKEMRQLELSWLRARHAELSRERRSLHARLLRTRVAYVQQQQLVESIWHPLERPGVALERSLSKARALRDALAAVSTKLRAAAEYANAAARVVDDALPAWKLTAIGKNGWERTVSCADACARLVEARCLERSARRVLAAQAAPRAARSLRLALDYAFTDALHDRKYQQATEVFVQFKDALVQLVQSIHQVLLNNLENLAVAEKDVSKYRRELRAIRVKHVINKGLGGTTYEQSKLNSLKMFD